MCGIAGQLAGDGGTELARHVALKMASAIKPSPGPDDADAWVDPLNGVALAHRRLAIVDLSEAGHQPMHSHDGRLAHRLQR